MSKGASRLSRCIRAPIRALSRARDLYVRSMTGCAGRVHHGMAMSYPRGGGVPRSFSYHSNTTDEDTRELIRAVSQRRAEERMMMSTSVVPRSQSVAVGRIDEEAPMDFAGDIRVGSDLLFPRSRSYAVGARTRMVGGVIG